MGDHEHAVRGVVNDLGQLGLLEGLREQPVVLDQNGDLRRQGLQHRPLRRRERFPAVDGQDPVRVLLPTDQRDLGTEGLVDPNERLEPVATAAAPRL
jgi:hypothetical protein